MITNINEWKKHLESLKKINENKDNDEVKKAKFDELISLSKEVLKDYRRLAEFKNLKKIENEKVKELLEMIDETSIIADKTLIEVFKPYKRKQLNTKAYFKFVEESVNVIADDFRELSDTIKEAATKSVDGKFGLRKTANTKFKKTGTMEFNENKIVDMFNKFIKWIVTNFNKLINKINRDLAKINKKADKFNKSVGVNESLITERAKMFYSADNDKYYLQDDNDKYYIVTTNPKTPVKVSNSMPVDVEEITDKKTIMRFKKVVTASNDIDAKDLFKNAGLTDEEIEARNKYSREYKKRKRAPLQALKHAKKAIAHAQQEDFYKDLIESKEARIIELLQDFDAKSVAIDGKIISLVKYKEKEKFNMSKYKEQILNANIVDEAVAKMAQALMDIHTEMIDVSGSTRHFDASDADLEDGSFNGKFDIDSKRVIDKNKEDEEDEETNEGILSDMKKMWKKLVSFIKSFKTASKDIDTALDAI